MNNKDIQQRLQNIISTDKMVTKQMAMKTKHLYKKLHFLANETETFHQNMHEKKTQLITAEKELAERQELLNELQEKQTTLRNKLHRLRKKVADQKSQSNKREPISPDDRFVYTKNALKKSLLGECTKTQFYATKKHNRTILTGYVDGVDKLHPFQEKIEADSEIDSETVLWNKVKLASPYLDEWDNLFAVDYDKHSDTM